MTPLVATSQAKSIEFWWDFGLTRMKVIGCSAVERASQGNKLSMNSESHGPTYQETEMLNTHMIKVTKVQSALILDHTSNDRLKFQNFEEEEWSRIETICEDL